MTMADDERSDLSVSLEWPEDPLDEPSLTTGDDPIARLEARLAELEDRERPVNDGMSRLVSAAIDEMSTRIDFIATELLEALRAMDATIRDVRDAVRQLETRVSAATTEMQKPREAPAARGGTKAAKIDEATIEELVTRVSDEVEIRVAAALKPKPQARTRR